MTIFAVTTASGQETEAANNIAAEGGDVVHAVVAPHTMTGYIFVEGTGRGDVISVVNRAPYAHKVVEGEVSITEIDSFLTASSDVEGVDIGDIVVVTDGAYEGNRATVTAVNEPDEKVTVEFLDEPIVIPVELPGTQIRRVED